ncbi:MAG: D-alanyl-D-alanine carboxypeptidase family protein [Lachnospiraceae bacterium]
MSRTDGADDDESGNSTDEAADTDQDISFSETAQLDTLNSPYAILMDASTGEVLAEQNADTQMYPASMTKILTAVTAMESVNSLDEILTMPYEIYATLYEEGASMAGFEAGEQASVRQLLYGVILPSGAECCIALADLIDGSESAFVQRMNEKAQALGMSSTHFVTCTGLHDAQHYSTVRDIAVLLQYALQSSDFREIFTAHSYSVAPTAQHPEGFTFYSTMFQSLGDASVTGGEILGGKTGYTEEAGLCLASLAQVNGREYILVTAGAPGSHDTEPLHTIDAKAVYNRIGEATNNE